MAVAAWLALNGGPGWLFLPLAVLTLGAAVIGRALFYVAVIPTTMPGAFFWRNRDFVEHARDSGLAELEQLGVVYERHHRFDLPALLQTVREHSPRQMWGQVRQIFAFGAGRS